MNPGKGAKWENWECDKKLGYICKRGNATLDSFIIPKGRFGNYPQQILNDECFLSVTGIDITACSKIKQRTL